VRGASDLITIHVTMTRELTVDLEQLEANPLFHSILDTLRTNSPSPESTTSELICEAVKEYVRHYIKVDAFPHRTPGTNGPGNVYNIDINTEVLNANSDRQSSEVKRPDDDAAEGSGDAAA